MGDLGSLANAHFEDNAAVVETPLVYARPEVKYFPVQKPYEKNAPVTAIVVGAGIGGTTAALLLSRKVGNIALDVYDRNSQIVR
jgi:hypothetical protein